MKKLILLIIIHGIIIFIFTSCSRDDNSSLTYQSNDFNSLIESDQTFIEILEINNQILDEAISSIKTSGLSSEELLCINENQILSFLGFSDNTQKYYSEEIYKKICLLEDKYSISKIDSNQLSVIIHNIHSAKGSLSLKGGDCEDQFESDFNDLHENYDSGVVLCGIASIITGGTGFIACNAINIYKTCLAAAEAIDAYNACINQ